MKLQIITIGQPKLDYAKVGWQEYWQRLGHYHQVTANHILDKNNDAAHILEAASNSFKVVLDVDGRALSSHQLADFLEKRSLDGRVTSFIVGGPSGLPAEVIAAADCQWSLSALTFPHDLAMLILVEALYRASTINAGQPYHK